MNLLITGAWREAASYFSAMEAMGHRICFLQQEKALLPCPAEWVEGIICNNLFLHHAMDQFPNLRYIQLTSAGMDRVPMDEIESRGITVYTAKDVYSIPMAEHALACVLWFYRGLGTFQRNQQAHIWEKRRDLRELRGKTVLIVGCGHVGQACAGCFMAMGCRVVGVDRNARLVPNISEIWNISLLESCLREADIVIICLPLTAETRNMFHEHTLACMKDGAVLINISRGEIVSTADLLKHIPRLGGVALDVLEEEPLSENSPLWDMPGVLITPHNSFVGEGNPERLADLILANLQREKKA